MAGKSKKSGTGKFFLGAILGSIAGAIAGRFITAKNEEESKECNCGDECECHNKQEENKQAIKKEISKKSAEKTPKK